MEHAGDRLVDAAGVIADHLAEEALWGGDLCTWLSSERPGDRVSTLDPWLYAGDAGVALFLAEAARLTGDRPAARTARGAILRALAMARERPRVTGLYEGTLGVALAAGRVAAALHDEQILEAAHAMAVGRDHHGSPPGADLIVGMAGDILALVTLADELDEPLLLRSAGDLATKLLGAASTGVGMSWTAIDPAEPDLTGLAHGAAGAVMALSELLGATSSEPLPPAIAAACDFERAHFDESHANWVDRRRYQRRRRTTAPQRFMVAWCHGAPGIALSRLSAYAATRDEARLDEARIGMATTLGKLDEAARNPRATSDWSLCHGVGGLIDVLGEHAQVEGAGLDGAARARELAGEHATRFSRTVAWPCGADGRQTPGLMIGLAGVGMTYLRLVDHRVPSALWVRPGGGFG
jgi:lantibiotic modifying enzyme